jgi:hypothetical protein
MSDEWDDEIDDAEKGFRHYIEQQLIMNKMQKYTVYFAGTAVEIPYYSTLIESVKRFAEKTPDFGEDDDKKNIYVFENDCISMAFRCAKEHVNKDGSRTLFVMVRDFTDSNITTAVQGCVWEF